MVAGDLAAAIVELAARPEVRPGPLRVAGADAVSRLEFARLVAAAAHGRDPNAVRGGARPEVARATSGSTARARSLVRTPLRGVREVLAGDG